MKALIPIFLFPLIALADDAELAEKISKFQTGARDLSDKQDELAADVQQLTIEQTVPQVIELFREVEDAMDEASERLYEHETGGETIAAETDVIEKIFEAAKEKQKQSGPGKPGEQPGSAMLDMMERMMGREPGGQKPGDKPGDQAGEGSTGDSNSENSNQSGNADGKVEERRVPKGSGTAGKSVPPEFQDALRAYNRAAEKLSR
ncbi:hypothetical protein ACFQY0_16520 [Haloferula chungangensis]|uniref:DUF4175 domain-containing protein n=1 Tax=Haloferula chungangensis TaxID=1048331 RepID=A0ABW2L8R4_9BACT